MKGITLKTNLSGIFQLIMLLILNSCSFSSRTCNKYLEEAAENPFDVIIVPGVPFENGQWGHTMKGRVYWSKHLYDIGATKNIIYSGNAVYTPFIEAEIMALYAKKLGIDPHHIFVEILAEHSTENIYYGYRMARKLGFERIALASDPFQTKMLKRYVQKRVSQDVGFIPMVIDSLKVMQSAMSDPEIDFQQAYVNNFVPITERQHMIERFRGTRGLLIDSSAYR
jgi:vancomycin permeability regulator SanA